LIGRSCGHGGRCHWRGAPTPLVAIKILNAVVLASGCPSLRMLRRWRVGYRLSALFHGLRGELAGDEEASSTLLALALAQRAVERSFCYSAQHSLPNSCFEPSVSSTAFNTPWRQARANGDGSYSRAAK
jgi:hypothetical protein